MDVTAALRDRRQAAFMDRVFPPRPDGERHDDRSLLRAPDQEYRWKYKEFVQCGELRADLREGFPQ